MVASKEDTLVNISKMSAIGLVGVNTKFIGRRLKDNRMGVIKFPLYNGSYDCINEVVCYELGKLLGFDVAEASMEKYKGQDCIISCYMRDDIGKTSGILSLKHVVGTDNFYNIFTEKWIIKNYGEKTLVKFIQMLMFDYMTRQEDRHISNIAFYGKELYSLYDNGRCLFYGSDYKLYKQKVNFDLPWTIRESFYDNEHGFKFNYLEDIVGFNRYKKYINNNVKYDDIIRIFSRYYPKNKAEWLSKYVYSVYKILMHKSF